MSGAAPEEVLKEKQARRVALRAQFWKEVTNPHLHSTGEGGTIFDPAVQRYVSTRSTMYDYFKPNAKTAKYAMFTTIIPMVLYYYVCHTERSTREAKIRRGEVAYKDRQFKFI